MNLPRLKAALPVTLAAGALLGLGSCASVQMAHGIPNFAQVGPGVWRGGQPNAAGWAYLKSLGVRRDVKLNPGGADADALAALDERRGDLLELAGRHEAARGSYTAAGDHLGPGARFATARLQRKQADCWTIEHDYER